jgi:hypothetical protein
MEWHSSNTLKSFITWANVIKHFTMVIYCHSAVILSFSVIKLYYLGNYVGMAVNYRGICETNVIKHNFTKNGSKLLRYFKLRKGRVLFLRQFTAVFVL